MRMPNWRINTVPPTRMVALTGHVGAVKLPHGPDEIVAKPGFGKNRPCGPDNDGNHAGAQKIKDAFN